MKARLETKLSWQERTSREVLCNKFINLRDKDIKKYIINNKPYDKAGSYGIQDPEFIFVDEIKGSYENVIGLPISKIYEILLELNVIK